MAEHRKIKPREIQLDFTRCVRFARTFEKIGKPGKTYGIVSQRKIANEGQRIVALCRHMCILVMPRERRSLRSSASREAYHEREECRDRFNIAWCDIMAELSFPQLSTATGAI